MSHYQEISGFKNTNLNACFDNLVLLCCGAAILWLALCFAVFIQKLKCVCLKVFTNFM